MAYPVLLLRNIYSLWVRIVHLLPELNLNLIASIVLRDFGILIPQSLLLNLLLLFYLVPDAYANHVKFAFVFSFESVQIKLSS